MTTKDVAVVTQRLIASKGDADGVAAVAGSVGIMPEKANAALLPAITGGRAKQTQAGNGAMVGQSAEAAASYTKSAASDGAVAHGSNILDSIFGSKDVSVAAQTTGQPGLNRTAIKALSPTVGTRAASALGNGTGTVAASAGSSVSGMRYSWNGGDARARSGATGALLGAIDYNKDGNSLDDISVSQAMIAV